MSQYAMPCALFGRQNLKPDPLILGGIFSQVKCLKLGLQNYACFGDFRSYISYLVLALFEFQEL